MNPEETDKQIRSYLPIDRAEYGIKGYRRNESRILVDLRPDDAEEIAAPLRTEYMARVKEVIERHGDLNQIDSLRSDHAAKLRDAKAAARNSGCLKEPTPTDQVLKFKGQWPSKHYNGAETNYVLRMLKPGEEIVRPPTLREIHTSMRVITRDDIRAFASSQRPRWAEGPETTCTSENILREAERAEQRVNERRRTVSSGPAHLIGTLIEN